MPPFFFYNRVYVLYVTHTKHRRWSGKALREDEALVGSITFLPVAKGAHSIMSGPEWKLCSGGFWKPSFTLFRVYVKADIAGKCCKSSSEYGEYVLSFLAIPCFIAAKTFYPNHLC